MPENPSPSIIRSQRNDVRRPPSIEQTELDAFQDGEDKLPRSQQVKLNPPEPESIDLDSHGKLQLVKPKDHLGYFSTRHAISQSSLKPAEKLIQRARGCSALILNKMVGTGIFVAPPTVLAITGSKGISLVLWLLGGLVSWAG